MGMTGLQEATVLNGKGYKTEMEFNGEVTTNCITESGGWSINPMTGSSSAEDMTEVQYDETRTQIFIGGPFTVFGDLGYKAEALGNESVGDINAAKVQLTSPEGTSAVHLFDPGTGYLLKTVQESDMQGQMVETISSYSDYKEVDGITLPHTISVDVGGGMFVMSSIVTKVEVNKTVDPAIFIKP